MESGSQFPDCKIVSQVVRCALSAAYRRRATRYLPLFDLTYEHDKKENRSATKDHNTYKPLILVHL